MCDYKCEEFSSPERTAEALIPTSIDSKDEDLAGQTIWYERLTEGDSKIITDAIVEEITTLQYIVHNSPGLCLKWDDSIVESFLNCFLDAALERVPEDACFWKGSIMFTLLPLMIKGIPNLDLVHSIYERLYSYMDDASAFLDAIEEGGFKENDQMGYIQMFLRCIVRIWRRLKVEGYEVGDDELLFTFAERIVLLANDSRAALSITMNSMNSFLTLFKHNPDMAVGREEAIAMCNLAKKTTREACCEFFELVWERIPNDDLAEVTEEHFFPNMHWAYLSKSEKVSVLRVARAFLEYSHPTKEDTWSTLRFLILHIREEMCDTDDLEVLNVELETIITILRAFETDVEQRGNLEYTINDFNVEEDCDQVHATLEEMDCDDEKMEEMEAKMELLIQLVKDLREE